MKRFKTVDEFIEGMEIYQAELIRLREILSATKMTEEVKWGQPCYTYKGKNVVGIGAFKSYFGLWFYQGALLKDEKEVLINAQEGKTKGLRQWRMESKKDIKATIIKSYVKEALALVDDGKEIKVTRRKNQALDLPDELAEALSKNKKANSAFSELTDGKKREYAEYIRDAKRAATKEKRLLKIMPMIESKVALHDQYRNG